MSPTWECRLCNVGGPGGIDAFERHYVEHQRDHYDDERGADGTPLDQAGHVDA